ncbi:putative membrane protein [Lachnospiraceae bacterium PF1-21]|uniref:DUF1648 domain-containing protein n=1 Tax=Ohessyouella blattaphilus TaxID=2949333 RepID=UPI003E2775D1
MTKGWRIYQKVLNILSLILVAGSTLFLVAYWSHIPDVVPAHYGASGEVDRYGSKGELIFVQVFLIAIYLIISLVERQPRTWNTGVTMTERNKDVVHQEVGNILITIKFTMMVMFVYVQGISIFGRNLGVWFMSATLIATFGSLIFFSIRVYFKSRRLQ